MRLDEVTAEIRPRSDWEAVDLGFAMVRRDFWRCFAVWWLAVLAPAVVAGVLLWDRPLLFLVLFWWWKPAGSRMVLFEISRRLFGEEPGWRAVWREIPRAWTRRFFYRFGVARFSPWLPVTLAVEDLEGLRASSYRQRCHQVVRRGEGVVMWIYFAADAAAVWMGMGVLMMVLMFIPDGMDGAWQLALETWDPETPHEIPVLIARLVVGSVMVSMSLADVFVTGAGFGIYINNRTWLEGWDVELSLRRMAQRLGTGVAAVLLAVWVLHPVAAAREPAEAIAEVKADEVFKVHTVTERVPVPKSTSGWEWLEGLAGVGEWFGTVFFVTVIGLLVGLALWLAWKFRHVFVFKSKSPAAAPGPPRARVVMGMEVTRDSLPKDVPAAAWLLWQQGRWQESLGLLYRGAIAGVMEVGRVPIEESDTEADCLRRVEAAGEQAHPKYFNGLTVVWSRLAYAGLRPADGEVKALCDAWPFSERRDG